MLLNKCSASITDLKAQKRFQLLSLDQRPSKWVTIKSDAIIDLKGKEFDDITLS